MVFEILRVGWLDAMVIPHHAEFPSVSILRGSPFRGELPRLFLFIKRDILFSDILFFRTTFMNLRDHFLLPVMKKMLDSVFVEVIGDIIVGNLPHSIFVKNR